MGSPNLADSQHLERNQEAGGDRRVFPAIRRSGETLPRDGQKVGKTLQPEPIFEKTFIEPFHLVCSSGRICRLVPASYIKPRPNGDDSR